MKFKAGDEVRMISTYKYGSTYYPKGYPGVGSIGTVLEMETYQTEPEEVVVTWTTVRSFMLDDGTFLAEPDIEVLADLGYNTEELGINAECLQLVVPSDREIKRALRSIERSLNGEPPLPEPLPPEYAEVLQYLKPEEGL